MRRSLEAELAAARLVARAHGLGAVEPQVLKLAKHTSVRLAPLPIVARIQSNEPTDRACANAVREVTIGRHLAARGAPTVRPAFDAGPYVEDECTITFWEFAAGRAVGGDADVPMAASALKDVHAALEDLNTELPPFTEAIDSVENLLANAKLPTVPAEDRLFLQRLYADLRQELSRRELAYRPLHGDTHFGNVLMTSSGALWMDLEAVCTGPPEWDFIGLQSDSWSEFGEFDPDLMRLLADLRSLCVSVWCWADFDRSDEVAEAAIYHLDVLKARHA